MKKVFLTLVAIVVAQLSLCQTQDTVGDIQLSKVDIFDEQSGNLFKRQFEYIGNTTDVVVKVVKLNMLTLNDSTSGLRFEFEYRGTVRATKIATLDLDEAQALHLSLVEMKKQIESKPNVYTELYFISRTGFEIGIFYSNNKWNAYLKTNRYDWQSRSELLIEDFKSMEYYVRKAIPMLF